MGNVDQYLKKRKNRLEGKTRDDGSYSAPVDQYLAERKNRKTSRGQMSYATDWYNRSKSYLESGSDDRESLDTLLSEYQTASHAAANNRYLYSDYSAVESSLKSAYDSLLEKRKTMQAPSMSAVDLAAERIRGKMDALKYDPTDRRESYIEAGRAAMEAEAPRMKEGGFLVSRPDRSADIRDFMDEDQRNEYLYIYGRDGKAAADEYLSEISGSLEALRAQKNVDYATEFAQQHPGRAFASSVVTNFLGTFPSALYTAKQTLKGEEIDPYAEAYMLSRVGAAQRQEAIEGFQNVTDNEALKWLIDKAAKGVGGALDSASRQLLFGPASTAIMATGAASEGVRRATERGYSKGQSLAVGAVEGALEYIIENAGFERVVSALEGGESAIKTLIASFIPEAIEEGASSFGNAVADTLIAADKSELMELVAKYEAEGNDRQTAWRMALKDTSFSILEDMLVGGISGGLMGGVASTIGNIGRSAAYSQEEDIAPEPETRPAVAELARELEEAVPDQEVEEPTVEAAQPEQAEEIDLQAAAMEAALAQEQAEQEEEIQDAVVPEPVVEEKTQEELLEPAEKQEPKTVVQEEPEKEEPVVEEPSAKETPEVETIEEAAAAAAAEESTETIAEEPKTEVESALQSIKEAGSVNTPYEKVIEATEDIVASGAVTQKQITKAYEEGLAEYNSKQAETVEQESDLRKELSSKDIVKIDGFRYRAIMRSDGKYYTDIVDQRKDRGYVDNARDTRYSSGPFNTREEAVEDIVGVYERNFAVKKSESAAEKSVSPQTSDAIIEEAPVYDTVEKPEPEVDRDARDRAIAEATEEYGISNSESYFLNGYTSGLAYMINKTMYDPSETINVRDQVTIEMLISAIRKHPQYKGRTYRNMIWGTPLYPLSLYEEFMKKHAVGEIVEAESFLSASKEPNGYPTIPEEGQKVVHMVIDGVSAYDISESFGIPHQKEVLYLPGTKLKIERIERANDGQVLMYTREVAASDKGRNFEDRESERSNVGDSDGEEPFVHGTVLPGARIRGNAQHKRNENDILSGRQESSGPDEVLTERTGGKENGSTEDRSDEGIHEEQNAAPALRGDGGEVLPGVLQTELPGAGGERTGTRIQVLRESRDESSERADGNDAAGSSRGRSLGDREGVAVPEGRGEHEVELEQEVQEEIEQTVTEKPKGANFVIGESLNLPSGEKSRYKANVAAIRTVKALIAENRNATAEEQEVLSKYVGWGGIPSAFNAKDEKWAKEYKELQSLLTPEEYKTARASTLNAHYTSVDVIRAMYDGLKHLGFKGGRMLEPSGGVGHFMGAMPADMQNQVKSWTMVELDEITGNIAKYLYPNNDVRIEGFEKAKIPNNYMDVAIGNVPFGNYAIADKTYPNKVTSAIHNYFFAKSLDKVRPGGLVMFITSRYTMDAYEDTVRKYIMDKADLLGAIRLPDTSFKGNAGTEVVTDIIVLRKRAAFTPYKGEDFGTSKYTYFGGRGAYVNEYFASHPEMVLGTPEMTGSMYGKDGLTYKPLKGDLGKQIADAFKNITGTMEYPKQPAVEKINRDAARAEAKGKEGSLVAKDNKIYKIKDGQLEEHKTTEKQAIATAKVLSIRDTARNLLNLQLQNATEEAVKNARARLNKEYDAFVKEYGFLNAPGNKRLYSDDVDAPFVSSLENYDAKEKTASKADIFSKNTVSPRKTVTHTDSAMDALIVSVNETGGVDMDRIAALTGNSVDTVSRELLEAELVYKNRDGAYETAEQYLSGNVKAKLKDAESLLPADKDYQRNIDALKKIIPADIPYQDIFVQPGATWIPKSVYTGFMSHMLNVYNIPNRPSVNVSYSPLTGEYIVQVNDNFVKRSVENTGTWGTADRSFADLFSALLNNRRIVVSRKDSEGKSYVDKAATIAAQEKAEAIKAEFQNWIWQDEKRRDALAHLYNETFNNTVTPKYNGENLTVDGISAAKPLRPHQKDVVQRIIASGGNTLIAHKVGAGKTAEMAAAAMKLRQLGVVKKPMFVVPKSVLAQWGQEFISFFPNARVLVPGEQDFTAKKRREFMNKIATGDYDAIIVSQENFSSIPVSAETEYQFTAQQIAELEAGIEMAVRNGQRHDPSVKQMEKKKKQFEVRLGKLNSLRKDEGNISFEELGVDSLFVDEAHSYKNLFYTTNMNNVSGLGNKEGAKRSYDLYMKVRYLQGLNGGRGIVFATATPVMNSMSEMYIMQKYLQSDLLKQRGLETFDAWANMFGEVVTVMEMNPTGKGYRQKESFSRFKNLGELQQMFRSFADVMTEIPGLEIPKIKGGKRTVVVSPASQYQLDYIEKLAERADKMRNGRVDPKEDNMLKITSEGRKLSYSQKIMDPSLPYEEDGKIMKCVGNVYDIWKRTKKDKMAQLVFCDIATPKGGQQQAEAAATAEDAENVSIYDDMKRQLILRGIPAKEIAFIHDADTQEKKNQLFDDVNAGKVRVLIGSTGKMGVGMNAQKRLYALHHLDAPWRPGDIEQREGRILRQGNINKEVEIFTYVTEKTFDARMWDNLERKASFINSVMNGDTSAREAEDVGEMVLSFAEIKSIASGNPLIMEQFEVNAEITKLSALKRQHTKSIEEAKARKFSTESSLATARNTLPRVKQDIATRKDISGDNFKATVSGTTYTDRAKAGEAVIAAWKKLSKADGTEQQKAIGKIAGFDLIATKDGEAIIRGENSYFAKINPENAAGTMQSITATLRSIDGRVETLEANISAWQADIKKLDAIISAPFDRQDDLNKAISRNNEITNILNPPEADASSVSETEDDGDTGTVQGMIRATEAEKNWDAQRVGDNTKAPMALSDIIRKMRHDFGIPVGKGRMSRRDFMGQYDKHAHSIKTRITNDLPTTSHELGHHLDNVYGITNGLSKDMRSELINQLSDEMRESYPASKQKTEGFAEFVRRYLQNKETAKIDYPLFFQHFQDSLSAETLSLVDEFADEINAYYSLDADTAQSSIRDMGEKPLDFRSPRERIGEKANQFYHAWIDRLHGIKLFDRAAGTNVYMSAVNSAYADTVAYAALTGNELRDLNGKVRGDGLKRVLSGIDMQDKAEMRSFGEYLIVKHGPERLEEGMRVFADDRKNSALWMNTRQAALEQQYPHFEKVADKLYDFQRLFLQVYGVETGLISSETALEWEERWKYYVPFNRAIDKYGKDGARKGFANQDSTIRKARGSGEDFYHPVDNIINNMAKMITAGIRNNVMLEIRNAATQNEGLGYLLEKVPAPMEVNKFSTDGLKQQLQDQVMESGMSETETNKVFGIINGIDDFLLQFKQGKNKSSDTVTVLVNGKQEFWKINDPMLLDSLTNMSRREVSKILEWYGSVSRLMTSSLTGLNLVWSIGSNSLRDFGSLVTYSKDKNIVHIIKGMASAYVNSFRSPDRQDAFYKEFMAIGGGSESAYTADKDMIKDVRAKLVGSKSQWINPIRWIEAASNIIERGPRYATYKMMRDMGFTPQEAIYASHEITVNFRRGGNMSMQINKVVPFFNAGVQGVDKLFRWMSCEDVPAENRAKAIRHRVGWYAAAFGAIGVLQWLINSRDDEDEKYYAQLSNYTKNNFWCIPVYEDGEHTGEFVTIPKPRELAVPSSFVSALLERTVSGNEKAFREFDEYALGAYLPGLADDAVKGLIGFIRGDKSGTDIAADILGNFGVAGVAAYAVANRDFLGKPIVSAYYEGLERSAQYNGRTSKLAYLMGQAFDFSPMMTDYVGQQLLGGFWKTQKALFPMDSEETDYTLGLKNTYRRDSQYSTDLVNDLYSIKGKATSAHKTHPDDMEKAIAYKEASSMTDFYSRYNKLEGSNDRVIRQIVLDMIDEFNWSVTEGERSELQKEVDELCRQLQSTEYMCSAMSPYIKDDNGVRHDLTAAQYVEFQGLYNSAYWEYVGTALRSGSSYQQKGIAVLQARSRAKKEAESIILSRMGVDTKYADYLASAKDIGLSSDDDILFQAALEAADQRREMEGESLRKEDVYDILDGMDLTDEQRAYLFDSQNYSGASNIYSTAEQLNDWIAEKRSGGSNDSNIARSITEVYKSLYIESWLNGDTAMMAEITQKLTALDLRKNGSRYYTPQTFRDWIEDYREDPSKYN